MNTDLCTYRYVGGRKAVDVKLPSGRVATVSRGETLDVAPSDATALDRHPEWEPSAPETDEEPHE